MAQNNKLVAEGKKPASGHPLLLRITKASLSTDSSSRRRASRRRRAEAAVSGKVDNLRGLKENVDLGRWGLP